MRVLILILSILLCACSSMSEREKAWHVVHLVDVAQTYHAAKSPCHYEVDPITSNMIGTYPDTDSVLMWGAVNAVIYHYAEDVLPDTIMNMHFVFKVGAINGNSAVGLTPSGYRCF